MNILAASDPITVTPWGAVIAAFIAGLFSFLALVISKENKTSEFRQAWIDALREEIADFIAGVRGYHHLTGQVQNMKLQSGSAQEIELRKIQSNLHEKIQISSSRIRLRLHTKGAENFNSAELLQALDVVSDFLGKGDNKASLAALIPMREKAQVLLKAEWEKVKKGEPWFAWSRGIFAFFAFIAGLIFFGGLLIYAVELLCRR